MLPVLFFRNRWIHLILLGANFMKQTVAIELILAIQTERLWSMYKSAASKSKHEHGVAHTSKLLRTKLNNVKIYWKWLSSCGEQGVRTNVTNDDLYQYFENISNPCDEFYSVDPDIRESLNNIINNSLQEIFEEQNVPFYIDEVYIAVKELKKTPSRGNFERETSHIL